MQTMQMTTALWCVLAAALLPYFAVGIAKSGGERYDNRDPRACSNGRRAFAAALTTRSATASRRSRSSPPR